MIGAIFWIFVAVVRGLIWLFMMVVALMASALVSLARWYRTLSPAGQVGFWIAFGTLMIIGLISWAVEAIVA